MTPTEEIEQAIKESNENVRDALNVSLARNSALQSALTTAQEENKRLAEIIQDFKIGFELDIFGVLPNGNEAFGYDEGIVRGNEYLDKLIERFQSALNGGK